jgi:pimeloyl-ACP methyl ester carboxylesterase
LENPRIYGDPPYRVALLHGGPGAGGEMAPVARELERQRCDERGVLEPIQTATTLDGQVEELRALLEGAADLPAALVGYSWGAWLGYILAARHPSLVSKLVLVSSGPFEAKYVAQLGQTRRSRLLPGEQAEFEAALTVLGDPQAADKDAHLRRLGELAHKTDNYDPLPDECREEDRMDVSGDVYQGVWHAAAELRRTGGLLALAALIRCPVTAIHGDYDPHPAEGVRVPLSAHLAQFTFHLLERCGHTPWQERHARAAFYCLLRRELDG